VHLSSQTHRRAIHSSVALHLHPCTDPRKPMRHTLCHHLLARDCSLLLSRTHAASFLAFVSFFLRDLPSAEPHKWQCRHAAPFMQPAHRQYHPHGLQRRKLWLHEPIDSAGCRSGKGSITTAISSRSQVTPGIAGQLFCLVMNILARSSSSAKPSINMFFTLNSGALKLRV